MKNLYESIFDDDDIIKGSDENIKEQLRKYLGLDIKSFKYVDITLGNPVKISINYPPVSNIISYNIFEQPPMDIEYEYLDNLFTPIKGYKGYTPKINQCKILNIQGFDYLDKIKIDDLDTVKVISDQVMTDKNINEIITFSIKNNINKFIFNPKRMTMFPDIELERLSGMDVVVIEFNRLYGVELKESKLIFRNNSLGKIWANQLNKFFDKGNGRIIIFGFFNNKYNYFEVLKSTKRDATYGYIFKKITEKKYEDIIRIDIR